MPELPKHIANKPKPQKDEAIKAHRSRMTAFSGIETNESDNDEGCDGN